MTQYNDFAEEYEIWTNMPLRKYAWRETIEKNIGTITGDALDLACGNGLSTEILSALGANRIVGVDIAEETLKWAEKRNILNTRYVCGDVSTYPLHSLGRFDTVTALFLFEYLQKKESIANLIKNIKTSMKPNATFYSLTIDQTAIEGETNYYGINGTIPHKEGERYTDNLCDENGKKLLSVDMYFWKKPTIEELLVKNGLSVEWLPVHVSKEGIKKYGKTYWEKFYKKPVYAMLKARMLTE